MSKKLFFDKEKQLKGARNHLIRIVLIDLFLLLIAYWKGLLTSGNNILTVGVIIIFLLPLFYCTYIANKTYKQTLNSIEFIDLDNYLVTYSKWFSSISTILVHSDKISLSINKIDPNKGTIAFSSITFYGQSKSHTFKVTLDELKTILLFCSHFRPLNLSMNEIWDLKEISSFKGFEELKTIV